MFEDDPDEHLMTERMHEIRRRLTRAEHQIHALEEAICPQVAARLARLEKLAEKQKGPAYSVAQIMRMTREAVAIFGNPEDDEWNNLSATKRAWYVRMVNQIIAAARES